jgi:isochorismate pyruvate lyase
MKAPSDCHTMEELRAQIDALDASIVAAFALRARYINRAASIKQIAHLPARIEARVEEVIAHVREVALAQGLDPALTEALWRQLIEWSIAQEEKLLGPSRP